MCPNYSYYQSMREAAAADFPQHLGDVVEGGPTFTDSQVFRSAQRIDDILVLNMASDNSK